MRTGLSLVLLLVLAGQADARPDNKVEQAAKLFEQGQQLYARGRYEEALTAFSKANQLAPHQAALFNIARCHENMSQNGKALETYRALLEQTTDPAKRLDIEQRIRRLASIPVKVFVNSRPEGAQVFVDASDTPASTRTPAVVKLAPGKHLLLLKLPGHRLATRRVEVKPDKEQVVEARLEPLPRPAAPPEPCPACPACPKPPKNPVSKTLHVHLLGATGFTQERETGLGPGVQIMATFRRMIFGAHFVWLVQGRRDGLTDEASTGDTQDIRFDWRLLLLQAEGGVTFPMRAGYLYTTLGLGIANDRRVKTWTQENNLEDDSVKEEFAFVWTLGGGVEAMVTPWLSVGGALRIGAIHGFRTDYTKTTAGAIQDEDGRKTGHWVLATLWGNVTFHL